MDMCGLVKIYSIIHRSPRSPSIPDLLDTDTGRRAKENHEVILGPHLTIHNSACLTFTSKWMPTRAVKSHQFILLQSTVK